VEEVFTCSSEGLVQLLDDSNDYEPPSEDKITLFHKQEKANRILQYKEALEQKQKAREKYLASSAKTSENPQKEDNIDPVEKVSNGIPLYKFGHSTLGIENSLFEKQRKIISLDLFSLAEKDRCKCIVFKDLWLRGYYVTDGVKFGGDFLAYNGDPEQCHAQFVVQVRGNEEEFTASLLASSCRLTTSVNKSLLVASVYLLQNSDVVYTEITWVGVT